MANSNTIPDNLKKELLAIDANTVTVSDIATWFGYTAKRDAENPFAVNEPKFNTMWKLHLDANEYINKEPVDTHVGIFLFNKLFIEGTVEDAIPNGYYNEVITAGKFKKLMSLISEGIMNEVIPIVPNIYNFLRNYEFWSLKLVTVFSPSFTSKMLSRNPQVEAAKKEVLDGIENEDVTTMVNAEDKLVDMVDKITAGDPGKTVFNSGARGSFENDYKNMMVSVGPTQNPVTGEYDFIKSSYLGGISKQDLAAAGNIIINAEYPKALGTAKGGYLTKQFYAVFQNIVYGEPGSDCHTNQGLIVEVTKDNIGDYIDQYAFGKTGPVLISKENAQNWIGKKIKVRSPMFCTDECICNKCAGERFYKLGIRNAGLTTNNISSRILNSSLKLRHSLKIKLNTANLDTILR